MNAARQDENIVAGCGFEGRQRIASLFTENADLLIIDESEANADISDLKNDEYLAPPQIAQIRNLDSISFFLYFVVVLT